MFFYLHFIIIILNLVMYVINNINVLLVWIQDKIFLLILFSLVFKAISEDIGLLSNNNFCETSLTIVDGKIPSLGSIIEPDILDTSQLVVTFHNFVIDSCQFMISVFIQYTNNIVLKFHSAT